MELEELEELKEENEILAKKLSESEKSILEITNIRSKQK